MGRAKAAVGSVVFLVVAPGTVAGLVPWVLSGGWRSADPPVVAVVVGWLLVVAGAGVLLHAFARFVVEGIGTPAPVAPTRELVVGGLYRYVRNPMYVAVVTVIVGQALLLWRPELLAWALLSGLTMMGFAKGYEEPTLLRDFGESYAEYRRNVPGWWPRLTPWRND
ncbi:methyltransferase family protein [Cryptosporangium phraense]|uniref:Isoprenylcysteine carboxylmethyltransferase family protein n=1 Tax=Cryptosporangium phraense TaxID=2593070 RepID=A0A545ANV1_9ACTN|nr:isoprenylcysteine carboxylmethyltransferase family protein [Cryptosporangium phraense]TQS43019.1 isoprenylcysteine carboxylmethyltransferase family protein [Cryptosporangium phraense]